MSTWYYYNEQGEKIETTGGRLKGLAKAGMITPETIIETEEGKKAPARKVKGLTFATTVTPESASPVETKSYGIAQPVPVHKPPVEVNPFTVPVPKSSNPLFFAPPVEENPFAIHVPIDSTSPTYAIGIKVLYYCVIALLLVPVFVLLIDFHFDPLIALVTVILFYITILVLVQRLLHFRDNK